MVEQIGSRTGAVAAAAPSIPVQRVASPREEPVAAQRELSALALDVDKALPPVDTAHVEEVRRAIRNGTYPVLPETIADRLLALKLNWSPRK